MEKKCIIENVYERTKNVIIPTLLTFQNGNLIVTDKDRVQYCKMTNRKTRTNEALVVVDQDVYTGPVNATEQLADTYICVRNKATNKVRILPLDQAKLKNFIYTGLENNDLKDKLQPLSQEASRKKLAKDFRGRKAANMYDTGEKMQVSVDVIKEDLSVTVQETEVNEEDLISPTDSSLKIICPKFNKDATTLSEIYDMNDLIPTSLLDRLDSEAKAVFDASLKSLPIKSQYLLSCIENLKKGDLKRSEVLYKIKTIIFMDALFNFLKSKERKISSMELSGITEKIEFYIRRSFFDQTFKNSTLSDKALCYYILLCILNDKDNSVDVAMLAEELGKSKKSILTYAHLVNALPNRSQSDVVTLRLPKKVPALKGAFQRKNNRR